MLFFCLQVTVHFDSLPAVPEPEDPEAPRTHEMRLWIRMAEAGVLVAPGFFFASSPEMAESNEGHYRIAFSMGPVSSNLGCPLSGR